MLDIFSMVLGIYGANCYIVMEKSSGTGFIIDPGADGEEVIEKLNANNIRPEFILLTHGHIDHVGAVDSLVQEFNIPVYIAEEDMKAIEAHIEIFGEIKSEVKFINEQTKIKVGNCEVQVIETPGHTKGGLCFLVDGVLFTGDTLFRESIGRTDFYGGNYEEILSSIEEKLFTLEEKIVVLPGHGPKSTIAFEKSNNPFLN
ncbi:MBL fold metallo-hydrolase [Inconstantimicrobium mannanitabidum]|uniref:MBL fold hydrolase n=1 Tax=Inconstantimicrobium mannanitabidum TaxID=1604901 RepID=A0ACB5RAL7_9CLOT|nr:MBL fold metallo-hydrolase [Clostridium sp. TW13]GKX66043.1 MBL fold hydrolase [Clostridium sp. TW13]